MPGVEYKDMASIPTIENDSDLLDLLEKAICIGSCSYPPDHSENYQIYAFRLELVGRDLRHALSIALKHEPAYLAYVRALQGGKSNG